MEIVARFGLLIVLGLIAVMIVIIGAPAVLVGALYIWDSKGVPDWRDFWLVSLSAELIFIGLFFLYIT